jgi:hypothetical protein
VSESELLHLVSSASLEKFMATLSK